MEGYFAFSLSQQGKTHVDRGVVCQDYSDSFYDERYAVVSVSDGHGSENFVRSDRGSKYACEAALEAAAEFLNSIVTFETNEAPSDNDENSNNYCHPAFDELHRILCIDDQEEVVTQLCKNILARWNEKVRLDYEDNPFSEEEVKNVSEKYQAIYLHGDAQEHAYGATLQLAILTRHYFLGIRNGDGECVTIDKSGCLHTPIPENDLCVANYTTSLCDSCAIDDFRYVLIFEDDPAFPLAVFLGSDGVDNSYTSNEELFSLYRNISRKALKSGTDEMVFDVIRALEVLTDRGSGDDVSIAGILNMAELPQIASKLEEDAALRRKAIEAQKAQKKRAQEERERARLEKKPDSLTAEYKNLQNEIFNLEHGTISATTEKNQQDDESLIQKPKEVREETESVPGVLIINKEIENFRPEEFFGQSRTAIYDTSQEEAITVVETLGADSDKEKTSTEKTTEETEQVRYTEERLFEENEDEGTEQPIDEVCVEEFLKND